MSLPSARYRLRYRDFFAFLIWVVYFALCALLALRRNANVLADHEVTLTDEALIEVTPHVRCETKWTGVVRVRKTRRRLFVFLGPSQAHIPANHYFVMGDNRDISMDSLFFGFVPRESIIGRAVIDVDAGLESQE